MSNTGNKLRQLFDFQRFEREPNLQSVIDKVESRKPSIRLLTDEELEYAAGGAGTVNEDDPQANGRCREKGCGSYLRKTVAGYICPNCGAVYDTNGNPLIAKSADPK